jgi:hypothetical protein
MTDPCSLACVMAWNTICGAPVPGNFHLIRGRICTMRVSLNQHATVHARAGVDCRRHTAGPARLENVRGNMPVAGSTFSRFNTRRLPAGCVLQAIIDDGAGR